MNKSKSKQNKVLTAILAAAGVIIALYVVSGIYFSNTGRIKTEIISNFNQTVTVEAEGVAVRDEVRGSGKENRSILRSSPDGIFVPSIGDGSSVAKGDYIAYKFSSADQAEAYAEIEQINREIEYLNTFGNIKNPNLLDVSSLNSAISRSIDELLLAVESGDLSDIDALSGNVNYALISRQFATGETVDFSGEISDYAAKIRKLEKKVKKRQTISAPFAGYFVDSVDGFEDAVKYGTLEKKLLSVDQVKKLMKKKPEVPADAFGKIVGQHIWYFVANIPVLDAAPFVTGSVCTLSFPEKGVKDIEMTVVGAKKSKDMLAVHFKSKQVTPDILHLRAEKAVINTKTYEGLKIDSRALAADEKGNIGVYVYAANIAVFKPIDVIYRADGYVLCKALENYPDESSVPESDMEAIKAEAEKADDKDKKEDEKEEKNEKLYPVPSSRKLKEFDRVIVKGRNIYDRKVLS